MVASHPDEDVFFEKYLAAQVRNNDPKEKRYNTYIESGLIDFQSHVSTFLSVEMIVNTCPENVYIYPRKSKLTGDLCCIKSIVKENKGYQPNAPCVTIKGFNHEGRYSNIQTSVTDPAMVEQYTRVVIDYDMLIKHPIYVKEYGIVVSLECHKDDIKLVHPHSIDSLLNERHLFIKKWMQQNKHVSFYTNVNDPTGQHNLFYYTVNGIVCCTTVMHNPAEPAYANVYLNCEGKDRIISFDPEKAFGGCDEIEKPDEFWVGGTSGYKVKVAQGRHLKKSLGYISKEDMEGLLKEQSEIANKKINALEEDIKLLKQEKTRLESIIENHKAGVKGTHEERKWDYEINKLDRESMWDIEKRSRDVEKHLLEREIQELKVKQTQHSTAGSEAGMIAHMAKAAMVVVPVIVAVYVAAKSSAAAAIAAPAIAAAAITGAAVSCISAGVSKAWSFISSFW